MKTVYLTVQLLFVALEKGLTFKTCTCFVLSCFVLSCFVLSRLYCHIKLAFLLTVFCVWILF